MENPQENVTDLRPVDWLDLMLADHDLMLEHEWAVRADGRIRNELDQCPLCCLAEAYGCEHYKVAASFAARYLQPNDSLDGVWKFQLAVDLRVNERSSAELVILRQAIIHTLIERKPL